MPAIGTRKLKLFVDGTEYTSDVSSCKITADDKDSDFVTFADAAAGGARVYKLALTMRQDTTSTALWYKIWSAAGTDVAVVVWPNGQNTVAPTTPTATYPKFSGTATVVEPNGDLLGGDADKSSTAQFVTEVEWEFVSKPVLAIT
jgi:hypothetical protein